MAPRRRRPWPRRAAAALLGLAALSGCGGDEQAAVGAGSASSAAPAPVFVDAAAEAGLGFVHFNGMSGELYLAEMMGSGVGLVDFDGDGDLDVFLPQGRMLDPAKTPAEATFPLPAGAPPGDRLFRNDLETGEEGSPVLRFTDVTAAAGLGGSGYAMGVAAGDYDNDGRVDLYVTELGRNRLLRNDGGGRFTDVTGASGTADPFWGASAAFFDFDRDGWLDLYVVNYVDFTVASHKLCRWLAGAPDYCGPSAYAPLADRLFRNRGDGTFEDVSGPAGILAEAGAGLGVATGDWNGDGWPDLFVANDGMANFLWLNQRDGSFRNHGLTAGAAFNLDGEAEAGMGVAAGDYDGDGDEDLLLTHLALETHTLYRHQGEYFEDVTAAAGLAAPSWPFTGFGAAWIDFDNDGWLDLMSVNGAVKIVPELAAAGDPHPLGMANQLWRNRGGERFEDLSAAAGGGFGELEVSRGLAVGDLDNDGDLDAVVTANAGPVRLLLNRGGAAAPWLGLRLVGESGRDALGAWVRLRRRGGDLWRRVRTDGSYLSASDSRLLFGLGGDAGVEAVDVVWPNGRGERFRPAPGGYRTLEQGTGEPLDDAS